MLKANRQELLSYRCNLIFNRQERNWENPKSQIQGPKSFFPNSNSYQN